MQCILNISGIKNSCEYRLNEKTELLLNSFVVWISAYDFKQ
jgi:hypothetical protein